jgi:hypothetical protein
LRLQLQLPIRFLFLAAAIAALLVPVSAWPQEGWDEAAGRSRERDEEHPFSLQAGLGFTADPDSFLLEFEGAFDVGSGLAFGPALQLGIDDDLVLVSPFVFGRFGFDLSGARARELRALTPYFQAGSGLTFLERDRRGRGDRDDVGFLMNFGLGFDYALTEQVSLGSRMLFNILPA